MNLSTVINPLLLNAKCTKTKKKDSLKKIKGLLTCLNLKIRKKTLAMPITPTLTNINSNSL